MKLIYNIYTILIILKRFKAFYPLVSHFKFLFVNLLTYAKENLRFKLLRKMANLSPRHYLIF